MPLVTPAEFREHFETDLTTAALQRVLDGVEAEVLNHVGTGQATVSNLRGTTRSIFVSQPVDSITSIIEIDAWGNEREVSSSDYQVADNGFQIIRRGDRVYWDRQIIVSYVPKAPDARVKLAIIQIAKMEIQFNGTSQETAGGYVMTIGDIESRKARIIERLKRGVMVR